MLIYNKNKGSALITALLITAIVAGIATIMAVRQRVDIRETELTTNYDRAYLQLEGIQNWAISTIAKLKSEKISPKINLFPIMLPNKSGIIIDAQGLFNINSLENKNNQIYFERLLAILDPQLKRNQIIGITKSVTEWTTESNADDIYLKLKPPYRASHRNIVSVSELRLILGITPKIYRDIKPYIVALPTDKNNINVVIASIPILMMLYPRLTEENAKILVTCRKETNVNSCASKISINLSNKHAIYDSKYYLVRGSVKLGSQNLTTTALLYSTRDKNNQPLIQLLWQNE